MKFTLQSEILRPDHCDPLYLLRTLGEQRDYCALLESSARKGSNDFSFLALGARDVITIEDGSATSLLTEDATPVKDPLEPFEQIIESNEHHERLFMGYIGFISYEAVRQFEQVHLEPHPTIPDAVFVLPEVLLKINHTTHEVTLISHEDTTDDLEGIRNAILNSPFFDDTKSEDPHVDTTLPLPSLEEIEPYRTVSRQEHCKRVETIQESITKGEAFQVVLSQELVLENDVPPDAVYEQLRKLNPSPYMYFYQTPERTIVGASPETLIRVEEGGMLYRPIAGTRKRTGDPVQDKLMQEELLSDEKERCEHQMLVDLGRNDVGRVAEIGSVEVQNPFHIEQYAHVFHIVSDVRGTLAEGKTALDAVRSVFPAGTLTGAPKVRAMEIIGSLESSPRGIYGGAFGYIDLSGNVDLAIVIRTMLFEGGKISLRVGGGIVADSVPELEDNECLHKARSCVAAVNLASAKHAS